METGDEINKNFCDDDLDTEDEDEYEKDWHAFQRYYHSHQRAGTVKIVKTCYEGTENGQSY
jgi:hypothetical protein